MSDKEEQNRKGTPHDAEDTLAIVERIRSIPRIRPRAAFRLRMSLYSHLPALGNYLISRHEASMIERRILGPTAKGRSGWVASAGRIATAVAVILVLALGAFGTLTFAARNSNPGDALYSLKRFRENIEIAFTWDRSKKVEKSLVLAEARLSELDYLISRKKLDASSVAEVAGDYGARRRAVENILREDNGLRDARGVANQLKIIRTTEKNIEKRLAAAGAQAALAPAEGALVTLKDVRGGVSLNGRSSLETTAGADGQVSFTANLGGREARDLEAHIELDGRSEVLPVFPAAAVTSSGPLSASVSPTPAAVFLDRPEMFTLTLSSSDGSSVSGRSVNLHDSTDTSYINGVAGEVSLVTDSEGRCSFSVSKRSLERVSRVSAAVVNGTPQELGEVLVLGGLKAPGAGADKNGVTERSSGPANGPQVIELDNGLVRVTTTNTSRPGIVIESVNGVGSTGKAGPLYEPMLSQAAPAGAKTVGPRLMFAGAESAGYEVSFEVPVGRGTVRKTYRVVLARGNPYATVSCRVEVNGNPGEAAGGSPTADVSKLEISSGCEIGIGGEAVSLPGQGSTLVSFKVGAPFTVLDSSSGQVIFACPLDSGIYPSAWVVDGNGIAFRLPESATRDGADETLTAIIGVTDRDGIVALQNTAVRGEGEVTTAVATEQTAGEGFLITSSPSLSEVLKGKRRIEFDIFKRYEKVFGN